MNLFFNNFKVFILTAILYLICNLLSLQINFTYYPYFKLDLVAFKTCKKFIVGDY
jgi:hypothetical protein